MYLVHTGQFQSLLIYHKLQNLIASINNWTLSNTVLNELSIELTKPLFPNEQIKSQLRHAASVSHIAPPNAFHTSAPSIHDFIHQQISFTNFPNPNNLPHHCPRSPTPTCSQFSIAFSHQKWIQISQSSSHRIRSKSRLSEQTNVMVTVSRNKFV